MDALEHEYFRVEPLPSKPSDLPEFEDSHELDRRKKGGQRPLPPAPAGGTVGIGPSADWNGEAPAPYMNGNGRHVRPPPPPPGRRPAWQKDGERGETRDVRAPPPEGGAGGHGHGRQGKGGKDKTDTYIPSYNRPPRDDRQQRDDRDWRDGHERRRDERGSVGGGGGGRGGGGGDRNRDRDRDRDREQRERDRDRERAREWRR